MSINIDRENAHQALNDFREKWSLEKIKLLTIEEYVSNQQRGFCYDIEFNTLGIGSIRGGNSIKFGLYKRADATKQTALQNIHSDDLYVWHKSLGSTSEQAFSTIKSSIIEIIRLAEIKDIDAIDQLNTPYFWSVFKWKLVFMYAPAGTIIDIFSQNWLKEYSKEKTVISAYKKIMNAYKSDQDIFDYSHKVWSSMNNNNQSDKSKADISESEDKNSSGEKGDKTKLNTILFGPPGTGKTYNTINHALQVIEPNCSLNDRTELTKKFKDYVNAGQIVFTTFHQSYGYEEFIEGIKALPPRSEFNDSDEVVYKVIPGVFKKACETATKKIEIVGTNNEPEFDLGDDVKVWKISLGGAREQDVKTHCFDHSVVRIGWTDVKSTSIDDKDFANLKPKTQKTLIYFEKEMDIGDFVVSLYDAEHVDAVGIVIGDYEWDEKYNHYPRKRLVKWLWTRKRDEQAIFIADINKKNMVQQAVYRLWNIKPSYLIEKIKTKLDNSQSEIAVKNIDEDKKYIIIIDEINRGNISKIFGELITLIEPSKRLGADEALTVTLPYSGESFGVPSNVYIIGTMNTADRSIALMDTALRRRFEFIEMMPDYKVLSTGELSKEDAESDQEQQHDLKVGNINIRLLLKKINERISYLYDRDHQIGHAYFMSLKGQKGEEAKAELDSIFKNKIIPLLQEYFYDDWEKIQIVLGDHDKQFSQLYKGKEISIEKDRFIISESKSQDSALGFTDENDDIDDEKVAYRVNATFTDNAYLKISGQLKSKGSE